MGAEGENGSKERKLNQREKMEETETEVAVKDRKKGEKQNEKRWQRGKRGEEER